MWLVAVITVLPLYSILPWGKHGLLLPILACFILLRSFGFFCFAAHFYYDLEIILKTLGKKCHNHNCHNPVQHKNIASWRRKKG